MKERPILFQGAMVRALLDGSKTQTRRMVKDLPSWPITEICQCRDKWMPNGPASSGVGMAAGHWRLCPYGQPGDRLWVRETHSPMGDTQSPSSCWYRADREYPQVRKWIPSIHMRRQYSRILLEVVSVRVERLNDCSAADAIAEGIRRIDEGFERWHPDPADTEHTGTTKDPVLSYRGLWESINGAGSWDANPWVWVVEFKRVMP
jgi:hypothetical protein